MQSEEFIEVLKYANDLNALKERLSVLVFRKILSTAEAISIYFQATSVKTLEKGLLEIKEAVAGVDALEGFGGPS